MSDTNAVNPALGNRTVFIGSSLVVFALLAIGLAIPEQSGNFFSALQSGIMDSFGWFYIASVACFLFLFLFFGLSRFGTLRLGPDDSRPDFPYLTWLAMLFAAGMGIGLMFFAVAEPIQHFSSPPELEPGTFAAARQSMTITFFHWGFHAWAIYGVVGLSLAYFSFRYNLPLTIRSGLYPLLRERINGPIGDAVDIFAICGTIFGLATSLGLGVMQINSGLTYLLDAPTSVWFQVALIAGITSLAMISLLTGLDVGIRRLSELNLILAILLLAFVLVVGPTGFLMKAFAQNVGDYLDDFFHRTFNLYAYEPRDWISNWTLFYWAWWIAWSPFVGMFIARISRGRTVREFVVGVLFVPAFFTFLWMTVFGNTAISLDMNKAAGAISAAVAEDSSVAIFHFFQYLPFPTIASALAVLLVAVFFVTSSDSASMVVDTIASGGTEETPAWQKIYWCSLEGLAAALLLIAGGLTALQTVTLISALPFAIVILLLCVGLVRGMQADSARAGTAESIAVPGVDIGWRKRLELMLHSPRRNDVESFVDTVAAPALDAVAREMATRGLHAEVTREEHAVTLTVPAENTRNFVYGVGVERQYVAAFSAAEATQPEARRPHIWIARTRFSDGSAGYDVMGFTEDQLIGDVLTQYGRYQVLVQSNVTALYLGSPDPGPA